MFRILVLVVLGFMPAPALAEDCFARLTVLLGTDLTANGPYVAMNTNEMAGTRQVFRQSFVSDSHYLVEQIEPAGTPATLHYRGGAWHGDGAGGWTPAWQIDAAEAAAGIEALRQALVDGTRSADCELVSFDGTDFTHVWGRVVDVAQFGPELAVSYLVEVATGQVRVLTYDYTLNGMEVSARYDISPAPDLTLPLPPGQ